MNRAELLDRVPALGPEATILDVCERMSKLDLAGELRYIAHDAQRDGERYRPGYAESFELAAQCLILAAELDPEGLARLDDEAAA